MFTALHRRDPLHIAAGTHAYGNRTVVDPISRSQTKRDIRERQRAWLRAVIGSTGLRASQVATGAGVSDTTLSRLLNNPEYEGTLSQMTVDRIKEKFRVPGPEEYANKGAFVVGFAEAERIEFDEAGLARMAEAMGCRRNGIDYWRLKTLALEQVGYLAGDIVAVDVNATPAAQDVVCALFYDRGHGSGATIWRVYDPPFLVGAAADRTAYKPLLVDNDRVSIKGVVVASIRPHRLSATR